MKIPGTIFADLARARDSRAGLARMSLLRSAVAALVLAGSGLAGHAADKPIVIEMYTSQGCSSCPPADKLMAEIANKPNVIAWSLPVDYWDYIGWKDTFGKSAHTNRQKAYAKVRGDGQVYTPQAVINGVKHAIGSDLAAIRAKGDASFGNAGTMSVSMKAIEKAGVIEVEVGAAPADAPKTANLVLIRVIRNTSVAIGRGENSGRTINYVNIGRMAARAGEWNGTAQTFKIAADVAASPDADGWILILQAGDNQMPGAILAAAKAPGM